jgi:glycosyltransferase involved in cell wall biosynthesis
MKPALLSLVVPVYNSKPGLPELVRRVHEAMSAAGQAYELVLVDDGSADGSAAEVARLAASRPEIVAIELMRNYGQHNAVLCGVRAARGEVIVTLDDDLQNPPEEIPALLAALDEGHDVVYGAPVQERHGLARDLASRLTKLALQNVMGVAAARHVSAFRAFRAQLRDAFSDYHSPFVSIDVLLSWATQRFGVVRVRHDLRAQGQSQYSLRRLIVHGLNMMTGYSVLPLQLASVLGFVFSALGALVLLFVVGKALLRGIPVPGFPFLASCLAVFSGVQLFALGIIGEYMARIHFRTVEKPQYAVRRRAARG